MVGRRISRSYGLHLNGESIRPGMLVATLRVAQLCAASATIKSAVHCWTRFPEIGSKQSDSRMIEDKIVEVYAAADSVEAERLRELLEEEGIPATVVGDEINHLAGSMSFGGVASPRIWVHEQDKEKAAELIQEWLDESAAGTDDADFDQAEQQSELNAASDSDEEGTSAEGISALGKLLIVFGLGFVLTGAYYARSNQQLAATFAGDAEAVRVAVFPLAQGMPPGQEQAPRTFDAYYEYRVNGEAYEARLTNLWSEANAPATLSVHFKPGNPHEHWIGSLPSPWLPLVFGTFFGVLVMFIVYRLN